MTLSLNGIRASSVRLVTPWIGAWVADVDLDLGELPDLPTGPASLVIDKAILVGTIDPAQSGRFGHGARARVVAGAGGWEKKVGPKAYHNDAGVISTAVLATTAAEVLERVVEATPSRFGKDFVRPEGPASSVLSGLSWYVDETGTTIVGPRVPRPAPPTLEVLSWDARSKVATIAADELVTPGTILTDPRFGQAKIRDVEQTWGDGGARATAWTVDVDKTPSAAGSELVDVMRAIARDAAGAGYLARVKYRVVGQTPDGRFTLAPANKGPAMPPLRSIALAPAVPGMSVKVPIGTIAHVAFVDGDRSRPVVVGFEEGAPIEVAIGPALRLVVGEVGQPVALAAPVAAAFAAVEVALTAMGSADPLLAPAASGFAAALLPISPTMASTKLQAD